MSQQTQSSTQLVPVTQLKVEEVRELAEYFHVPQLLVNHYVVKFVGRDTKTGKEVETLFYKEPYWLDKMDPRKGGRGIQAVEFLNEEIPDGYRCTCTVYPLVTSRVLEQIAKLPTKEERDEKWEYFSRPTKRSATATRKNVRMSTMWDILDTIAEKRALVRVLKIMTNSGEPAYVESEDVELTENEVAQHKTKFAGRSKASPTVSTATELQEEQETLPA